MTRKVIICSNILWTITNYRKSLILALIKSGYEVSVIGSDESFSENLFKDLKELKITALVVPLGRTSYNLFRDITYFFRLLRIFRRLNPDVVLHFSAKPNIYGSIACRLLRIPFINTINGLGSGIIHHNMISIILSRLYRLSLNASFKVLFQNNDDKAYFLENNIICREKAGYVPGSGINIEKYSLPVKKPDEKRTFLFAGRILQDKGVYEYIDAIKELKNENFYDAEFLLGGIIDSSNPSGISLDEIQKWHDLNIIRYIGRTDDINEFFKLADIVVLPSYREGLSRVLLEAASCGKTLITTNVPGCKDILDDGVNGFICNPKDAHSLMDAMLKAIRSSDSDLLKFGINGRNLVKEKFTDDLVNKVYLTIIEDCLNKKT